jgi:hypothetical protein
MKFESQICTTKEQSERLLALGLKKETADCQHCAYTADSRGNPIPKRNQKWFTRIGTDESIQVCGLMNTTFIPAWSLHRLIVLSGMCIIETTTDNVYDKVIQYIAFLIKCESFNKEYLEQ